jgi:hypothetical protein
MRDSAGGGLKRITTRGGLLKNEGQPPRGMVAGKRGDLDVVHGNPHMDDLRSMWSHARLAVFHHHTPGPDPLTMCDAARERPSAAHRHGAVNADGCAGRCGDARRWLSRIIENLFGAILSRPRRSRRWRSSRTIRRIRRLMQPPRSPAAGLQGWLIAANGTRHAQRKHPCLAQRVDEIAGHAARLLHLLTPLAD